MQILFTPHILLVQFGEIARFWKRASLFCHFVSQVTFKENKSVSFGEKRHKRVPLWSHDWVFLRPPPPHPPSKKKKNCFAERWYSWGSFFQWQIVVITANLLRGLWFQFFLQHESLMHKDNTILQQVACGNCGNWHRVLSWKCVGGKVVGGSYAITIAM